ncbi:MULTISPECIES: hypothetical protein [Shewanella]|uniref:Uncharacterized protein n=2 Tax=Shewanella TaxID=22 RepID=A0A9X1ZBB6_9GAMM|nr:MULTISPECIES: hypothetical protein [Shewanella]MCL1103518.1 hypothetical protein [Shewanella saliphila]MCL1107624.1 hypothetical protein [Shewanella algicola]GGP70126.1 hypothetical protein GCM10009409_38460 [Shewanella saliphila]GGP70831.1 hypothetical protein GCM10009347_39880 [Shewanella algicola]
MDINIKLVSKPDRLSSATLTALLSHFQKAVEQSVFETMCDMNKRTSRTKIQKFINNNIHLDVDRVERGSFILFLVGSLSATVTLCIYEVIKSKIKSKVTEDEIKAHVEEYQKPILENLERDIKKKNRFGSLYVDEIKSKITTNDKKIMNLDLEIKLSMPDKEHTPVSTEEQIKYVAHKLTIKSMDRENG